MLRGCCCSICRPYAVRARAANLARIQAVAASLQPRLQRGLEAAPEKQETPEVGASEVSTAHPVSHTEVRAAGAQSDTPA